MGHITLNSNEKSTPTSHADSTNMNRTASTHHHHHFHPFSKLEKVQDFVLETKMTVSPSMPENRYHVRSISLPSRSHPLALRGEEEINKLRSWETSSTSTSETICIGLGGLGNLYNCVEDFLQLPLTQQSIAHHQQEKWVEEVLDGSVRLLDVCSETKAILSSIKEQVQALRFALRRRSGLEVEACIRYRKKAKKDITKLLGTLKRMDDKCVAPPLFDQDQHLSVMVRMLRDSRAVTISVLTATLTFLSSSRPTPSKRSLVSKLMHKELVAREGAIKQLNEFENVDVTLSALSQHMLDKNAEVERMQVARKHLEALELGVVEVEAGLECLFRRLIQIRVSLTSSLVRDLACSFNLQNVSSGIRVLKDLPHQYVNMNGIVYIFAIQL